MNGVDGMRCTLVDGSRRTLVHRSRRRLSPSACFLFLPLAICGIVKADPRGDPPPVVVDSIEPVEIVQGQVPQPEIQVFGSNFIEGLPNETNRPTVTLRQPGKGGAEFSALAWVNFSGTVATVTPDMMNLLQAPLGVYDVIVTRPTDGASGTLEGAFTVTDGQPDLGEIAFVTRSVWGGLVNDVEVVGDLAYAAIGRRLVILNVADPANPFEVGSMTIMPGVEGVAVRDGYAFLGARTPYQFAVVDISNPANPVLVSAGAGEQFSHDVELYGDFAYVRATGGQVEVFDITDPQQLAPMGGVPIGSDVAALSIVGDRLYVGTGVTCCVADLSIWDLATDPLNPVLLSTIENVGKETLSLDVEGNYVVWTLRHEGEPAWFSLQVVNVSNPSAPEIVGSYNNGSGAGAGLVDVNLSGGYAYVANSSSPQYWAFAEGLIVFDIATNPTNPTPVATFKTHGDVTGIDIFGDRAYLHDAGEGVIILDISTLTKPVRLGNYHSPAALRQMDKVGDLLYVADAWNGFTVLDVSDATQPEVVSVYLAEHVEAFDSCADMSYPLGIDAYGIDIKNDTVYLGAGHLGLEVIDVSDPASPVFLGALRIDQLPPPAVAASKFVGVRVWDDVASIGFEARVCTSVYGIFLNLDVSDPANIFEVGRVSHGVKRATRIEFNESGIAFLGRGYSGSDGNNDLVIDTSIPASPTIIYDGVVPAVVDVALSGDVLYVASDHRGGEPQPGLYIQDVSNPSSPQLLNYINNSVPLGDGVELNLAYSVVSQGQRLYLIGRGCTPVGGCGVQAVYLLDLAGDPGAPVLLDALPHVGGSESSLFVDEPFVYATNKFDGPNDPGIGLVVMEVLGLNPVTTTTPDSFSAFRGFYLSGDLVDLLESDDSDLCYEPGIVLNPTEAPITLDFIGSLPNDSPASLDVTIESSANTVGLELTVSFWNFNTNSWDVVGTATQSLNADTVRTFAGNPADHVEAGTGEVRTRYEVRVVSFIFLFPWLDCVDHVFWTSTN